MFEIEKGVQLPADACRPFTRNKYPFSDLEVGESFFVPNKPNITGAIRAASLRSGRCFAYRPENGGVRVWRVEGTMPPPVAAPAAPATPRLPRIRRRVEATP